MMPPMVTRTLSLTLALCVLVACGGKDQKAGTTKSSTGTTSASPVSSAPPASGPSSVPPPATPEPSKANPSTDPLPVRQKACADGNAKTCNDLGSDWAEGKNGVSGKDLVKAKALYERACELKDGLGCFNLGNAYRLGEGVPVDEKQAVAKFTQACDMDEPKACTELGIIYYEGKAVPKDNARAITLLEKACKLGSAVACKNVSILKKGN